MAGLQACTFCVILQPRLCSMLHNTTLLMHPNLRPSLLVTMPALYP